jgi:hypothetical protein
MTRPRLPRRHRRVGPTFCTGRLSIPAVLAALCFTGLATIGSPARGAALYVGTAGAGADIGEYDATTGATINANFISSVNATLLLSGNSLIVGTFNNASNGALPSYDASTGSLVNSSFITTLGAGGNGFAQSGSVIYASSINPSTMGTYDAATGAALNAAFISGSGAGGIAVSGTNLFWRRTSGIAEYDAISGAPINLTFASLPGGGTTPYSIAIQGNTIYVGTRAGQSGQISEYDATTGALIDANFITGLTGSGQLPLAIAGDDLFVGSGTTVGEYDVSTGAAINANFIAGLPGNVSALAVGPVAAPAPASGLRAVGLGGSRCFSVRGAGEAAHPPSMIGSANHASSASPPLAQATHRLI